MSEELNGLVLSGGFSARMGEEKGLIKYHGFPQYLYAMQMLRSFCNRVYLACRPEQQSIFAGVNIITDREEFAGHGPISGLLSAFAYKNAAWMVLGCDYPYMRITDLHHLKKMRNPEAVASVFKNQETGYLEPLLGIYEVQAYPLLKQTFADENYSLRKFLESAQVFPIAPTDNHVLTSVDSLEEKKQALHYFRP